MSSEASQPISRNEIETLREKANRAYTALEIARNASGHGPECILRCIEDPTPDYDHWCPVCGEDEGTPAEEPLPPLRERLDAFYKATGTTAADYEEDPYGD